MRSSEQSCCDDRLNPPIAHAAATADDANLVAYFGVDNIDTNPALARVARSAGDP